MLSRNLWKHGPTIFGGSHTAEARRWFEDMWTKSLHTQSIQHNTNANNNNTTRATNTPVPWEDVQRWVQQCVTSDAHSPNTLTATLCQVYKDLTSREDRHKFLGVVASFSIRKQGAEKALKGCLEALQGGDNAQRIATEIVNAQNALTPAYHTWFRQVIGLPGGLQFLISMREDILHLGLTPSTNPELWLFQSTLTNLLRRWFAISWMHLHEVSWFSPAAVLSNCVELEAVHKMSTMEHIKQRVGPSPCRRCYGYFHPSLPSVPLVMIYVALTDSISSNVQTIIQHQNIVTPESKANTAVFYSITSTQKGLKGIDLGHYLIKGVVREIKQEFPNVATFVTLSPIPGFISWLKAHTIVVSAEEDMTRFMSHGNYDEIRRVLGLASSTPYSAVLNALYTFFTAKTPLDTDTLTRLKQPILQLVARYLVNEKKRKKVYDPVGNFHVRNGAIMHQLHFMANATREGCLQGGTVMVNYLYDLDSIAGNAIDYDVNGTVRLGEHIQQ
eukprot:PhF_6_TR6155/c3_g2_i1/m.9162/K01578/MLYCD; malonyl-CoA decarboxylase